MVAISQLTPFLITRLKYVAKVERISIDNKAFSLHYRVTAIIFLIFSAIITCNSLLGDPIKCIKSGDVDQKIIDNYCWIEGTYTLPIALIKTIEFEIAHPGVRQYFPDRDEVIEHTYYQWVSIVLFLQAMMFYGTRYIWKRWEGGRMERIIQDLHKCIIKQEDLSKHKDCLVNYLYATRGQHSDYAGRFMICEALNVVHVIVQFFIINWFLGGRFLSYGIHMMTGEGPDPFNTIFPKMTKCTFQRFGPSGDVQRYDNLCLLPLNILNEKGYIFIWFWLAFLGIVSIGAVLYSLVVLAFPRSRYLLLHNFNRLVPEGHFITILNHVSYGDWFLLYLLSKNLDPFHYKDVITQYSLKLDGNDNEVDGDGEGDDASTGISNASGSQGSKFSLTKESNV